MSFYVPPTLDPSLYTDIDVDIDNIQTEINNFSSSINYFSSAIDNNSAAIGVLDTQFDSVSTAISNNSAAIGILDTQYTDVSTSVSRLDDKTQYIQCIEGEGCFIADENGNAFNMYANKFKHKN